MKIAVGPWRISIAPESMIIGKPIGLHHRMAWRSCRACRSSMALVTRGSSFAGGTFFPSADKAQNPEISRGTVGEDADVAPEPAGDGRAVWAAAAAPVMTSADAMNAMRWEMVINAPPFTLTGLR